MVGLEISGATGNNLDNVNLRIPLGSLTCVTGCLVVESLLSFFGFIQCFKFDTEQ